MVLFLIGLSDLMDEIRKDFSTTSIGSLCSIGSHPDCDIKFMCFKEADPLRSILNYHYILSIKHHSDLFQQIWKVKLSEVKISLTFEDIVTEVWNPVFSECCQLVDSIRKKSIKLKNVDFYFRDLKVGSVPDHLRSLYVAVEACRNKVASEFDWIQVSADLMEQYWALSKQVEAANIVLDLKKKLKLTGNFEIIEEVASRVDTTMMDASLGSIGRKNLKEAKSFLDKLTEEKKECLKQFAACLSIVEWIRKETKG